MTAIATHAPRLPRPTWGQTFWAVIGGAVFAWAATLLLIIPMFLFDLPMPLSEGTPGWGWPWAWSCST